MRLIQACADFVSGYFSTHDRSSKTKAAYQSDLTQFREFVGPEIELEQLSSTSIEGWAAHLRQDDYAPSSIRRKIIALKVFCGYWARKGVLLESPFWRVKLSFGRIEQLPRTLTENEMQALLTKAGRESAVTGVEKPKPESNSFRRLSGASYLAIRNLALVDLLFATGMRVGEASALDLKDFSEREGMFRIQGKGGRDRVGFAVDEASLNIQKDHLRARNQIKTESSALFLNLAGKRLSTQGITNVISRLRKEAGIERHVTPHMLRHTVATLLLRNGVDIRIVQEFLGHASIATTQRYTHISKEHLISVLKKSHPSFNLRLDGRNAPAC